MTLQDACDKFGISNLGHEDTIGGRKMGYSEGLSNPPGAFCQCVHPVQGQFLYSYIRAFKPKVIMEIGCGNYCCATTHMALACKNNGFGKIHSYDLYEPAKTFLLEREELLPYVEFHIHDALTEDFPIGTTLIFEDGAHTFDFQEKIHRRIQHLLPEAKVFVHDVCCPEVGFDVLLGTQSVYGDPTEVLIIEDGFTGLGFWGSTHEQI